MDKKSIRALRVSKIIRGSAASLIALGLLGTSASANAAFGTTIGNNPVSSKLGLSLPPLASEAPAAVWQLPLAPDSKGQIHLLAPYRQPNSDYSAGHRGVDYRAALNARVLAPADGQIAFAGQVVNRKLVTIKHGASLITEFEPVCALLDVGTAVKQGDLIGTVCNELPNYVWHCLEPCLHFSLRSQGKYLSPLALIGGLSPTRLLPYLSK